MPKRLHPKRICHACRLHFHGDSLTGIAVLLDVNPATISPLIAGFGVGSFLGMLTSLFALDIIVVCRSNGIEICFVV